MPRVLYIDDDDGIRRLASRALSRRGFDVTGAASADDGLALLASGRFDVVAIDHSMPGRDGLSALTEMMTLPEPPPVVYVTGADDSRIAVAALKAGAFDYVLKAVGDEFFDLLAQSLTNALERQALVAQRNAAEEALKASNDRLAALVLEANHRVANSLQIVSSFIAIQANAASTPEARMALKDTRQRVQTIGRLHRRLYTSDDIEHVDMGEYLATVLKDIEDAWSTSEAPRSIRFAPLPLRLRTDQAVSVGVVVNELVSNACKYAYPEATAGEIRVAMEIDDAEFRMRIEDDGVGFSSGAAPKGTGIGTKLVDAMARSLAANVAYSSDQGARITLTVPLREAGRPGEAGLPPRSSPAGATTSA